MNESEIRYQAYLIREALRPEPSSATREDALYALGRLQEFATQHAEREVSMLRPITEPHISLPLPADVLPEPEPVDASATPAEPAPESEPDPTEPETPPVDDHLAEVSTMVPPEPEATAVDVDPAPRPRTSIHDSLLAIVQAHPDENLSTTRIREELSASIGRLITAEHAFAELNAMRKHRQFQKVGRGLWRWVSSTQSSEANPQSSPANPQGSVRGARPKPAEDGNMTAAGNAKGSANAYIEWEVEPEAVIGYSDFRDWWLWFEGQHGGTRPSRADWDARLKYLRATRQLPTQHPAPIPATQDAANVTRVRGSCSPELGAKMYRLWEITDAPIEEFVDWFLAEYAERGNAPMVQDWRERQRKAA